MRQLPWVTAFTGGTCSVDPLRAQPAAVNLTLPAEAPEDAATAAKSLEATLELWEEWHVIRAQRLPPDMVRSSCSP